MVGCEPQIECITRVEEESTLLLRSGRSVLDHRKACRSSGAIVVVHRNLKSSALQVGVRGIDSETSTATPIDLRDIQKD